MPNILDFVADVQTLIGQIHGCVSRGEIDQELLQKIDPTGILAQLQQMNGTATVEHAIAAVQAAQSLNTALALPLPEYAHNKVTHATINVHLNYVHATLGQIAEG